MTPNRIIVGITGASGSVYAERLVDELLKRVERIYLVVTAAGREVLDHELREHAGCSLRRILSQEQLSDLEKEKIRIFKNDDFFAPIASGSSAADAMLIVPCSMGTLGRVAHGLSTNLLERSADVMLKERRRMILVPRESPLSQIHLENMTKLCQMGVTILPPSPAFYQGPKTMDDLIDFTVGKLLESLDLSHTLYRPWNPRMR